MAQPKLNIIQRFGFSKEKLRKAIVEDMAVRVEARAELDRVAPFAEGGIHDGRCVISKEYAAILREALA